jgi:hypothetical protein
MSYCGALCGQLPLFLCAQGVNSVPTGSGLVQGVGRCGKSPAFPGLYTGSPPLCTSHPQTHPQKGRHRALRSGPGACDTAGPPDASIQSGADCPPNRRDGLEHGSCEDASITVSPCDLQVTGTGQHAPLTAKAPWGFWSQAIDRLGSSNGVCRPARAPQGQCQRVRCRTAKVDLRRPRPLARFDGLLMVGT